MSKRLDDIIDECLNCQEMACEACPNSEYLINLSPEEIKIRVELENENSSIKRRFHSTTSSTS